MNILKRQQLLPLAAIVGAVFSILCSIVFLAPAQAATNVSVTSSPSPASFTAQRPHKTSGSITVENNSQEIISVNISKAGSSCSSLANWAEYSWLDASNIGTIEPQSSKTVDINLDSRYLVPGEYSALLCVINRHHANPDVPKGTLETIPVSFTVEEGEGPAVESVTTWPNNYAVGVDEGVRIPATAIFDDGKEVSIGRYANWTSADSSIATVTYGWVKGVAAGETEMTVSYGGQSATESVTVLSDAPQLSVEPESVSVTATQGSLRDVDVTLRNTGGAQLDWNITFAKEGQDCSDTSAPSKPWLTITGEDEVGSLAPGASIKTGFSVLAYNFHDETDFTEPGEYNGAACITSNDPDTPTTILPIELTVDEAPQIDLFSPDWQFYTLPGGGHYVYRIGDGDNMIEIANQGGSTLEWQAYVANESCDQPAANSWLTLEMTEGEVAPGATEYLFFNPHGASEHNFELGDNDMVFCITSNDPAQPVATANLRLSVVEPHDMPMDYLELQFPDVNEFEVGATTQLNAMKHVFSGHTFVVNEDATWSSSDESVVTVDANGYMTAVGAGDAVVKAEYGGKSDTLHVTVVETEDSEQPEEPSNPWEAVKSWLQAFISALEELLLLWT